MDCRWSNMSCLFLTCISPCFSLLLKHRAVTLSQTLVTLSIPTTNMLVQALRISCSNYSYLLPPTYQWVQNVMGKKSFTMLTILTVFSPFSNSLFAFSYIKFLSIQPGPWQLLDLSFSPSVSSGYTTCIFVSALFFISFSCLLWHSFHGISVTLNLLFDSAQNPLHTFFLQIPLKNHWRCAVQCAGSQSWFPGPTLHNHGNVGSSNFCSWQKLLCQPRMRYNWV